jgi:antitoxin component YwqK of YwqJK toxin-antitoxin module
MIRFHCLVILLLFAGTGFAQQDSVRKYLDADLHFTTKKDFVFAAMAVKQADHWLLYAVYPDTSVLLRFLFKDAALTIKDGPFLLFHPKGIVAQKGYFKNNIANGHWQSFYPEGQLKDEGDITNNHFSGVWKAWYRNGLPMSSKTYVYSDSMITGEPVHENSPAKMQKVLDDFTLEGVLEGPSSSWYENGKKESEVNYHNDSLSGSCSWFRPDGNPSSKEVYTNGKVTDLECYDETGKYTGATCSILKLPVFIHPVYSATDYIVDELHKERHRGITAYGEAEVSFTVTQKGTVEKLAVTKSPDATLSKLILQIFAKMPAWSPAVTHNRKVDYPVKLVIPYYGD